MVLNELQIQRCDDVDLLGVNIDSKLSFDKHISSICRKVNKQLSVVKRFKHLIGDHIKRRLYNAFILPVFNSVVMFGTFVAGPGKNGL